MSGVADFLFEGSPPPSVTSSGQTVEGMPRWLSDYVQGTIARANAIGGEEYQTYPGARIAGFTDEQEQAYGMIDDNIGAWQPGLERAGALTQAAGEVDPLSTAQPYLDAANQRLPGQIGEYMDPFIGHVLNRQETIARRGFEERTLPSLQDAFTRAGHFGSDRMMDMAGRATRDFNEGLTEQQLAALSGAYGQAGQFFQTDAARQGALGQTAGELDLAGGELGLRAGRQEATLADQTSRLGYTDAASLEAVGRERQNLGQRSADLAYRDFSEQRDYPRDTIDWMSTVVRGMPTSRTTSTSSTGPAEIYQPSPLSQFGSVVTGLAGAWDLWQGRNDARGGIVRGPLSQGEYS